MTKKELNALEEVKRRNFNRKFGKRYGVELLTLQTYSNPEGQHFAELTLVFPVRMIVDEMGLMCENIATWVGGDLRGTVNVDYSGRTSLSFVVEMT